MILGDTSVWIDYFHNGKTADTVELLMARGELYVNDVILAVLMPSILQRGETELEYLMATLPKLSLWTDWSEIVRMQTENLKHGINKVGLPDLLIAQNAIQNHVKLFSIDRHFSLMSGHLGFELFDGNF